MQLYPESSVSLPTVSGASIYRFRSICQLSAISDGYFLYHAHKHARISVSHTWQKNIDFHQIASAVYVNFQQFLMVKSCTMPINMQEFQYRTADKKYRFSPDRFPEANFCYIHWYHIQLSSLEFFRRPMHSTCARIHFDMSIFTIRKLDSYICISS